MQIKEYSDIDIKLIRSTDNIIDLMNLVTNITMKQNFKDNNCDNIEKKIKYLLDANHTSVFEHINYTFLIEGSTRSFLSQITRHRMASYTSGSQHYQNYKDYGFKISDKYKDNSKIKKLSDYTMQIYNELIEDGIPNYEARQVLPNGMENNLIITINARSLINLFNLRLCYRNTDEIHYITTEMYKLCLNHFPELFKYVGPDCYMNNGCKQGKMSCGIKWKLNNEK